jgi:hypothetical protein
MISAHSHFLWRTSGFCPGKKELGQGKVWYDKEGDYLEVLFERKPGYFKEAENDAVMEKLDDQGNIIGFSTHQLHKTYRQSGVEGLRNGLQIG